MNRRAAFTFPIQTNRPAIEERTASDGRALRMGRQQLPRVHDGLYAHMALMLPQAHNRYIRFVTGRGGAASLVRMRENRDSLEIVFRPLAELNAPLTYDAARLSVLTVLTLYYGIPQTISGELFIEVGFVGRIDPFRTLGGQSILSIPFAVLGDIAFENALEQLMERGYVDVSYSQLQLTFRFDIVSLLEGGTRGGCSSAYETSQPAWNLPLAQYDTWTNGQKVAYGKMMMKHTPEHLLGNRGLWFLPHSAYSQAQAEKQLCGVVAFLYGVEEAKRLRGEPNLTIDYYRNPASLVAKAERWAEENGIVGALCNGDFQYLISQHCPDHAVFIYDSGLAPLYYYKGILYKDNGRVPFLTNNLTLSTIEDSFLYRINIFIDLQKQHYIPIFNIRLFFFPLKPKRKEIPALAGEMMASLRSGNTIDETALKKRVLMRPSSVDLPCPYCHRRASDIGRHKCAVDRCDFCHKEFTSRMKYNDHMRPQGEIWCQRCQTRLPNARCYTAHASLCTGVCYDRCVYCHEYFPVHKQHQCKQYRCHRCQRWVIDPLEYDDGDRTKPFRLLHECALKGKNKFGKKKATEMKTYAFDFECMLETSAHATLRTVTAGGQQQSIPIYKHTVNYAYAMSLGETAHTVEAYTIHDFWKQILEASEKESTQWYAHNLKGYDGRLLLDYFESMDIAPRTLFHKGDKIMTMTLEHPQVSNRTITFKDSLLHIAAPLSAIPAMFGMDTKMVKKGMFPYLFNTPEHQNYVGPVPDQHYFEPDMMSKEKREAFLTWHRNKRRNQKYSLRTELEKYCQNDVLILKMGLEAYAKVCNDYGQRYPLLDMTIAQYTFNVYLSQYMSEETLYYLNQSEIDFVRRALHGGKTDVRRFLYEQTEQDRRDNAGLRYVDIQSLYPTVQFYDPMPTGKPQTRRYSLEEQPDETVLHSFFGFIECDIEPTEYLHHPLLCEYRDKKLMAHLHPLKKVVITSVELQTCLRMALYRCSRVYRIDFYKKREDLFKEFVRTWLRLKIISGKCPVAGDDAAAFKEYAEELKSRLGIKVKRSDFQLNVSLRTLAKMVLNSLWGKFAQRDDLTKTTILADSTAKMKYYQRIAHGLTVEKDSRTYGSNKELKKYTDPFGFSKKNVAVAAFVTAHARLRLWKELHRLGERVYYHDTDSVIYYYNPTMDMYNVPEGPFLGDWESETGDHLITKFVALAPKTYIYQYNKPDGDMVEVVKAKGFSLASKQAAEKFTFENYKQLLLGEVNELTITQRIFQHVHLPIPQMITYDACKTLSFNYRKGVVDRWTLRSLPYGYERFLPGETSICPLLAPPPSSTIENEDVDMDRGETEQELRPVGEYTVAQIVSFTYARLQELGFQSFGCYFKPTDEHIIYMMQQLEEPQRQEVNDIQGEKDRLWKLMLENHDQHIQMLLHYHRLRLEIGRQVDGVALPVDSRDELLKSLDAYTRLVERAGSASPSLDEGRNC